MRKWAIYYADGSVISGATRAAWKKAPKTGVQVVVGFPMTQTMRWRYSGGPVRDRDLWTGSDSCDPFGWGAKRGSLIENAAYLAIWERACADSHP